MLYRAFLVLVVALWGTMWTLLIRSELQPNGAGVRSLPVEHVLREVFRSERDSMLHISDGVTRYGSLRISPKPTAEDGTRTMNFAGNFSLSLPGHSRQRISWEGGLILSPMHEVESFTLNTVTRDISPPAANATTAQIHTAVGREPTRLDLHLRPRARSASYQLRVGRTVMDQQDFALDEEGLRGLLNHLGVDETFQRQFSPSQASKPEVTARQASIDFRGTRLETYMLTLTMNTQTLLTVHVSQIGEILRAESIVGWKLEQE